jgi:adenylate cyclase
MQQQSLQFGLFTLDLERLCLRGPAGQVELRPKSFEVLRYLTEHAGRVISKEEVVASVWPDVIVTDDSLIRCISEVRRAIGDESQHIIKTVPRRGYLFDAPVSAGRDSTGGSERESTRLQSPQSALITQADRPSIAVLPFVNLADNSEDDYFCRGITEDIITELSRFPELLVIARHSSFRYKDKAPDVRQVGRELSVRYVLEGSIRRRGDRVRITAQLVDAETGAHRWAERYDRKLDDVFAIQDEVIRSIAPLLVAHVTKAEVERTLLKPPTTWQAYHYFMRGLDLHLSYQSSQEVLALREARRLLEQSISIDPSYARPYSALAISHLSSWVNYGDNDFLRPSALERAYQFSRQAVQLNPQLAYVQATFAHVLSWRREHEAALGALERALALNPNYSHWQVAATLMWAGELEHAIESMRAYMRLDPYYPTSAIGWLGVACCTLGRFEEARTHLREAVARSPNRAMFHYWLASVYGHIGDATAAGEQAQALLRLQPSFTISGTAEPLAVFRRAEHAELFFEGLRKCGFSN